MSTTTELTLVDINNYLNGVDVASKIQLNETCTRIKNADDFLLKQIATTTNSFNASSTTMNNFLDLYNEQYSRNMEAFVGILIISAILAKMMFFPTSIPKV